MKKTKQQIIDEQNIELQKQSETVKELTRKNDTLLRFSRETLCKIKEFNSDSGSSALELEMRLKGVADSLKFLSESNEFNHNEKKAVEKLCQLHITKIHHDFTESYPEHLRIDDSVLDKEDDLPF